MKVTPVDKNHFSLVELGCYTKYICENLVNKKSRIALGKHPQLIGGDAVNNSYVTEEEETDDIGDENINAESDNTDLPSYPDNSKSELDIIPKEDDNELDEELRSFRTERRKKNHLKKEEGAYSNTRS
ncbi:hypothetical protein HAX54_007383 [Datura stramonium]|uniref:Uncharacterized protein n=1 Tax=Datura stramonium TaxID=4076 RepID=A0ABS8RV27_DATST|nr:hypothetical protein [Datura stramonium]